MYIRIDETEVFFGEMFSVENIIGIVWGDGVMENTVLSVKFLHVGEKGVLTCVDVIKGIFGINTEFKVGNFTFLAICAGGSGFEEKELIRVILFCSHLVVFGDKVGGGVVAVDDHNSNFTGAFTSSEMKVACC